MNTQTHYKNNMPTAHGAQLLLHMCSRALKKEPTHNRVFWFDFNGAKHMEDECSGANFFDVLLASIQKLYFASVLV